ncbi:Na+/H+ antiporter subunit E [Clostridium sp. D2Q-14]|uniref:Na+/H+ antiporter subunit E n=1 Tax=Anaeromonas gelatinilytica TaxID=2683194 RepID=UPI00193B43F3|nr:Na+/H+ antiporter subunit E [Anaeromonas gelatinilytica]MBS4536493.1 Na+/H+ antiporter subunit E [Anaeromonas gelatinilytica]
MRKKFHFKLFITLYIFWLLLTTNGNPPNILAGFLSSLLITRLSYGILYDEKGFIFHIPKPHIMIKYLITLFAEIYKSAIDHIVNILTNDYNPTIVEVNLDIEDPLLVTLIANSITLTPETITVEKEGNKLLVLYIKEDIYNEVEKEIKSNFESIFITKGRKN